MSRTKEQIINDFQRRFDKIAQHIPDLTKNAEVAAARAKTAKLEGDLADVKRQQVEADSRGDADERDIECVLQGRPIPVAVGTTKDRLVRQRQVLELAISRQRAVATETQARVQAQALAEITTILLPLARRRMEAIQDLKQAIADIEGLSWFLALRGFRLDHLPGWVRPGEWEQRFLNGGLNASADVWIEQLQHMLAKVTQPGRKVKRA